MIRFAPLCWLSIASFALGCPAWATPQCAPRNSVLSVLNTTYGETRRSIGLAANNGVIEVFASAETGSWTITITMADGVTCLVASGQNYESLPVHQPAQGDPA